MAGFSLGTNGGDAGDSFMDAPPTGSKSSKDSDGWNPVSSFLNLVGVHVGESKAQQDAINKGAAAAPQTGGVVKPDTAAGTPADGNTTSYDSRGDIISQTPNKVLVNPIDLPTVNVPAPKENFLSKVLGGGDSQSQSANAPGSGQIGGNKDGSFGGGLMKALATVFGGGA